MIELVWAGGVLSGLLVGAWLWLRSSRQAPSPERERDRLNAQAYREQQAQWQARHAAGEVDAAELSRELAELDQRLVQESAEAPALRQQPWPRNVWLLLLLLPAIGGSGIFWASQGQQHFAAATPAEAPSVEQMVASLAQRLQAAPDDLQGWSMLGRSYAVLGRHAEAAQAYAQANSLSGERNADLLIAEAEALALARDQDFEGRPRRLLAAGLAVDPTHVRGLWYSLLAARQAGDEEALQGFLARLRTAPQLPPELVGILDQEFGAATQPQSQPTGVQLQVTIMASPQARAAVANGVLYVFAKAQQGAPMPLAVHRQPQPSQWPVTITLDDSMAMAPGQTLSSATAWTITARLSRSGQAIGAAGDWQGSLDLTHNAPRAVSIRIDQELP